MSKQLTIATTASVLTMALFAASTAPGGLPHRGPHDTGAEAFTASAPAWTRLLPGANPLD